MKPKKPNYYNQKKQNQNQNQLLRKPLQKPIQNQQSKTTSWGSVSNWYDEYLKDEDNYQHKVILPNLLRLLDIDNLDKDASILDLGCGQGFFIDKVLGNIKNKSVNIHGIDLSQELLKIAQSKF